MTTRSFTTPIRHDSDAAFRTWGKELHDELTAVGLVQTEDTGQIDWETVTRAGSNSDAGYEIWRFDDELQDEAPIFIKIYYGTGVNSSAPRTRWQVGTGSDGSGDLTGVTSSTVTTDGSAANSSDTPFSSYLCHTDGFFGLNHKADNGNTNFYKLLVTVERSIDTEGEFTTDGCFFQVHPRSTSSGMAVQYLDFANSTALAQKTGVGDCGLSVVPQLGSTSALGGGDLQAFLCWMATPAVVPCACTCVVFASEIARGANFNATLVGSVERTYIGTDSGSGTSSGPAANTTWSTHRLAMLWE